MPMATAEQMEKIQEMLQTIMEQNCNLEKEVEKEVEKLKKDNEEYKSSRSERDKKIQAQMEEWSDLEEGTFGMIEKLTKLKEGLLQNEVKEEFFTKETKIGELCAMLKEIGGITGDETTTRRGEEPTQEVIPQEPFSNNAREERMDCFFGEENNVTPVAMRRFVERYNTIKKMNIQLRITGWDSEKYRAGKIKLCLKGIAFDYVEFACNMEEEWAENDILFLSY